MLLELTAHFELGYFWAVFLGRQRHQLIHVLRQAFRLFVRNKFCHVRHLNATSSEIAIKRFTREVFWLVGQVCDLIERAQFVFGIAMAVEAPAHAVRLCLLHYFHFIDLAVTVLAGDAAIEMDAVIEVNKIRGLVNLSPFDRGVVLIRIAHHRQLFTVLFDLTFIWPVAVEAGLVRGHVRVTGHLGKGMTVDALHPKLAHVQLVRIGHWLGRFVANFCVFRCEIVIYAQ